MLLTTVMQIFTMIRSDALILEGREKTFGETMKQKNILVNLMHICKDKYSLTEMYIV